MSHADRMRRLIESAGGEIEDDRFVTRPGLALLARSELSAQAQTIFEAMHIDRDRPRYEQLAEFNARITYLSFRDEAGASSEDYNRKMVEDYGHLSVHGPVHVTLLIAGVSLECCQELVAHGEARVARLTSSRTRAQDEPLYVLSGDAESQRAQREVLEENMARIAAMRVERSEETLDDREWINRLQSGAKAVALSYTMSIKDLHKMLIGRLSPHGVEAEMRALCERIAALLHEEYPLVIRSAQEYYAMNNDEKYQME